jgi:hypothetical protein
VPLAACSGQLDSGVSQSVASQCRVAKGYAGSSALNPRQWDTNLSSCIVRLFQIALTFSSESSDQAAPERALSVQTSVPIEGSWAGPDDDPTSRRLAEGVK